MSGENGINPDGNLNLWEARFGLRMKLRPTGACDLSSVLSAIGLATAEGPAEGDGRGKIAHKRVFYVIHRTVHVSQKMITVPLQRSGSKEINRDLASGVYPF